MVSYRSRNYADRYIRHRSFLAFIDPVAANDRLGRKDATFQLVPGLAGEVDPQLVGRCWSLESVNYPHHFLRHENFRLKLAQQTNDPLFKNDASFIIVEGLFNHQNLSFESVNFRNHYIRHSNFELWLHKYDGSRLFQLDATFIESPNLVEHPPSQPIDPGTVQIPAES